ncbi:MAG: Hsp20/alpha crystallin family protein [Planctomycetaceae bacterium]|nr:Hsp20/alpha crystallin family protein [Planctomycetaceae bacterium]
MNTESQQPESLLTSSVERLRHELDRWLDVAWTQGERAMDQLGMKGVERDWCPPIDVIETGESVLVEVELPGIDPGSVDVTLAGNMLTVTAPIRATNQEGQIRRRERPRGRFKRSIPLPASVNPDEVSAETRHGLLTITVAKVEKEKVRHVVVKGASSEPALDPQLTTYE